MAYYIRPPRGKLSYGKLETYAKKRLDFLLEAARCNGNNVTMKDLVEEAVMTGDSDCLIEGTGKDLTSHFLLRLASSQDNIMRGFFIRAETILFQYRLSCMTQSEISAALKPLQRLQQLLSRNPGHLGVQMKDVQRVLTLLTGTMAWENLVSAYTSGSKDSFIVIPFHYALNLVRKRAVLLKGGNAYVPCGKLSEILTFLFERLLAGGMDEAEKQLPAAVEDERMQKLFLQLKHRFQVKYHPFGQLTRGSLDAISAEDVDNLVSSFPMCMSHLHRRLQLQHRLRHSARIQYTLFLKELGLPVHESLNFWRQEYTKSGCHGGGSCTHSWQTDGRRYTYSIRHLYGLEGCRKNYRGHCCSSLQNTPLSPGEQGGCPFSQFDSGSLQKAMSLEGLPAEAQSAIVPVATSGQPSQACQQHLLAKAKVSLRNVASFSSETRNKGNVTKCNPELKMKQALSPQSETDSPMNLLKHVKESVECMDCGVANSKDGEFSSILPPPPPEEVKRKRLLDSGVHEVCCKRSKNDPVDCDSKDSDSGESDLFSSPAESCCDRADCFYSQTATQMSSTQKLENTFSESKVSIHKPIDFYQSYRKLLDGMSGVS